MNIDVDIFRKSINVFREILNRYDELRDTFLENIKDGFVNELNIPNYYQIINQLRSCNNDSEDFYPIFWLEDLLFTYGPE